MYLFVNSRKCLVFSPAPLRFVSSMQPDFFFLPSFLFPLLSLLLSSPLSTVSSPVLNFPLFLNFLFLSSFSYSSSSCYFSSFTSSSSSDFPYFPSCFFLVFFYLLLLRPSSCYFILPLPPPPFFTFLLVSFLF
jgi:hypothetical protein